MIKIRFIFAAAAIAALIACGCAKAPVRTEPAGPLTITWEFNRMERDAEPYTEAALVINGSQAHRHVIGVFYGKVRRILKPSEINPEMVGGTLSGFTTVGDRRGHEVIVRYNEQEMRLIVAERPWNELLPPGGSFRVIKNIPVPEMRKEQTGF